MQELPESVKKMVGEVYTMLMKGGESQERRLELLTSTVSKSKYTVIQQLTGYQGLPKSLIILHHPWHERNRCGTGAL
jgi:hypothetical protein